MPIVAGSISSVNVALMSWLVATPVLPRTGDVDATSGPTRSDATPVVKLQRWAATIATPESEAAPARIAPSNIVVGLRSSSGSKVNERPSALIVTAPARAFSPSLREKCDASMGVIAVSKITATFVFVGTLNAPSVGSVSVTAGAGAGVGAFSRVGTSASAQEVSARSARSAPAPSGGDRRIRRSFMRVIPQCIAKKKQYVTYCCG